MIDDEGHEWLTVIQAAKRRGVSRENIRQAINRGTLKAQIAYETATQTFYWIRADWLEEWTRDAEAYRNRGKRKRIEQIGRRGAGTVVA